MVCPLCGQRKARRACPALGKQICAVCCGTKRLTEIQCPADCIYLATAREHPPAAAVRRHQRDVGVLMESLRDLGDRQAQLFFLIGSFLMRYQPSELQPVVDDDIIEAAEAVAATFETSARGIIYEHRPPSLSAQRLVAALTPVLSEAGKRGGTAFERDAAVVLRRVAEAAREVRARDTANRRAFLDLLGRVLKKGDDEPAPPGGAPQPDAPRLIVP